MGLYNVGPAVAAGIITLWGTGHLSYYFGIDNARKVIFYYSTDGTTGTFLVPGGVVPLNTWTHVAISKIGVFTYTFVGGVPTLHGLPSATTIFPVTGADFCVGGVYLISGQSIIGKVDEARFTNGVGRYPSGGFTPSTLPFPNF